MKKIVLNILLIFPLLFLVCELFIVQNINDPIKYIYSFTGTIAIIILFFTIIISMIKSKINLVKYRKTIGLYSFFYAFLHFLNFVIFDAQGSIDFIVNETIDKPFIYLGSIALIILLFMTITSTKELYRKYNKYHKLVYFALILIIIHLTMAQKSLVLFDYGYLLIIIIIGLFKLKQQVELLRKNT